MTALRKVVFETKAMIPNLKNVLICVHLFVFINKCEGQDNGTTIKTVFIETTTQLITYITDIPERDVEEALNIDYGRYTTQSFQYFNSQFAVGKNTTLVPCFQDHIKCLVTIIVHHPVCAFNDPWDRYQGYRTFDSYCDAYLDNCLRRMRFWHILDYGRCYYDSYNKKIAITQTRREIPQSFKNIFHLLTAKSRH